jgi:hypothetical protein
MIPPPPLRRPTLPIPPSLPKGRYVKVVQDPNGGFKIVTAYLGYIVGPRLDKGRATYPERSHRLSFSEANEAFQVWEKFCEDQEKEKSHERMRKSQVVGNPSDGQGATLFDNAAG